MNTLFTRIVVLSTMTIATMMAQRSFDRNGTPPDPATMIQRRVQSLTKLLNLTDSQASQATTIFTNALTASTSLHTSMQDARTSLRTAVKANNANDITQYSTTIGNLSGQLLAIQSKADAAFYAILTADQQAKYDELGPGGFGPGMGGMGPMGGPGFRGGRPRE